MERSKEQSEPVHAFYILTGRESRDEKVKILSIRLLAVKSIYLSSKEAYISLLLLLLLLLLGCGWYSCSFG